MMPTLASVSSVGGKAGVGPLRGVIALLLSREARGGITGIGELQSLGTKNSVS